MADFSKLNAAVAELSAKVDALNARPAPEPIPAPPVDDQPAVDAVEAAVEAVTAKIPA